MSEMSGRPPPDGGRKKAGGGGIWAFVDKVFRSARVEVNLGPVPSRAQTGKIADPAARMAPVKEDRKETHDEMIYRTTDGEDGQAPAVRVDRDRQHIARSLDTRIDATARQQPIPRGGGAPLSKDVRARMEPKLGADLGEVRVHTSGESAGAAEGLAAKAFTVGSDVHFGAGEFAPGTKEGDRLLAHELTHVVQGQRSGVQRKADDGGSGHGDAAASGVEVSHPDEPAEKEADAVAEQVSGQLEAEGAHGAETHAGEKGGGGDHGGVEKPAGKADAKGGKKGAKGASSTSGEKSASTTKAAAGTEGAHKKDRAGGAGAAAGPKQAGAADGAPSASPDAKPADAQRQPADGNSAGESAGSAEKSGGGATPSAAPTPSQSAPAIAAKKDPGKVHLSARSDAAIRTMAGRKIFRATTPTNPPPAPNAANAGSGSPGTPPSANADPYQQFCKTLPPDLQGPAQALTDAAQKGAIQAIGLAFARAFLALRQPASRLEMPALNWDQKSYLQTMALSPDEIQIYETLDAAKKPAWRDQLTPDERKDAKKMPSAGMVKLLTVPSELQTWRVLRVKAVIGPDVSNKLVDAGENVEQIVDALSSSRGGDRLRRILMDPQLPPGTKANFMRDVKAKLPTAPDPFEAMKQCQPSYKLLGNDASRDGAFATMEILKALPIVNFANYGSIPPAKVAEACRNAPATDSRVPRKSGAVDMMKLMDKLKDDAVAKALAKDYFPQWGRQNVGNLSGCEVDIVGGKGGLPAYWMYDAKAGMTLGMPSNDVAGALAVDENPAYQTGGVIVGLPQALKMDFAARQQIKRPTAIDGLAFDQFQIVDDPSQCFGITAGKMGEVVVGPTKFSATSPKRTF